MEHRTTAELLAGLDHVRASPADDGRVELIVGRPTPGQRELHANARLCTEVGLVGDGWLLRGSRHSPDGSAEVDRQLTVMNARMIALIAGYPERRALAGDQLYLDLDLSAANLPTGTRLRIGEAVIEVTDKPHTGCAKFTQRFGLDAHRFLRSPEGLAVNARGLNARVVEPGAIAVGDAVLKV